MEATVKKTDIPIQCEDGTKDEKFSKAEKREGTACLKLSYPVCYDLWTRLLITKYINNSWRLIGSGKIRMVKKEPLMKIEEMSWNVDDVEAQNQEGV